MLRPKANGSIATFGRRQMIACPARMFSCQIEEMVDELDLSRQSISCHPSNLPLPDDVDCFVALNGSPFEGSKTGRGYCFTAKGPLLGGPKISRRNL
jgi:hypothetical protein